MWNQHHLQGYEVAGVSTAEVLGTATHPFAGRGVMIRYQNHDVPQFVPERDLRSPLRAYRAV